ncbi:MAG: bifunctional riboflavin kinase/FAD synthetase [Nitrospinota bacterium]
MDQLPASLPYPVVTIGNFDGIHRGHQLIFRQVVDRAREVEGTAVVVTFRPYPRQVLRPDVPPDLLMAFPKKLELMEHGGLDVVLIIPFTQTFARTSPEDFITEILSRRVGVRELFVGHNFAFGKDRTGTLALLQAEGERLGIAVTVVGPVEWGGEPVSSSTIREALRAGNPQRAADLLGRPYSLSGTVVGGYREGRVLGFPTANLELPREVLIPADGVYAVRARWRRTWYDGVANIGTSPTFPDRPFRLEVHLFDFTETLYDEVLEVAFFARLREERRYPTVEALTAQMRRDAEQARALLAEPPPTTDEEVAGPEPAPGGVSV